MALRHVTAVPKGDHRWHRCTVALLLVGGLSTSSLSKGPGSQKSIKLAITQPQHFQFVLQPKAQLNQLVKLIKQPTSAFFNFPLKAADLCSYGLDFCRCTKTALWRWWVVPCICISLYQTVRLPIARVAWPDHSNKSCTGVADGICR